MEHLADVDAKGDKFVTCRRNVGHNEIQAVRGPGRAGREVRSELDRASGTRRRELYDSETVIEKEVGVESPAELSVEVLRAVDIRDGDDNRLQLQVDCRDARVACGDCAGAHDFLPRLRENLIAQLQAALCRFE